MTPCITWRDCAPLARRCVPVAYSRCGHRDQTWISLGDFARLVLMWMRLGCALMDRPRRAACYLDREPCRSWASGDPRLMIRLPTSADRMYKSTDQQYQDELAVPQDAWNRELPYCAPPKAALFDLVCGENGTLRFCCEFW